MDQIDTALGPIDYMVVEFPGSRFKGEIAPALIDLVDRELIRILDLLIIRKGDIGDVLVVELHEADQDELDALPAIDCHLPGLVADADIAAVAETMAAGSTAGLIVWENVWAAPLTSAVVRAGGDVVAAGRVSLEAMHASLVVADNNNNNQGAQS